MGAFNILVHLEKLRPDGGSNDPRGDHSFFCPVCGAKNFKVNVIDGKWGTFSCDCGSTENGKRKIRNALSPAINPSGEAPASKLPRQKQERHWDYYTARTLEQGRPAITVNRWDDPAQPDGKGWKNGRKINQTQRVAKDKVPYRDVAAKVQPYRLHDAKKALDDGAPCVLFCEGEPCCDAVWELGLPAITNIGGSGKFSPDRDGPKGTGIPADRLVVVPDRDKPGLKHAEAIANAYPGCRWLFPFPGTPEWNGSCPNSGGLDIADWITTGATVQHILKNVGPRQEPKTLVSDDLELLTYSELLDATITAIKAGNQDHEMLARASLKTRFRISDEQVNTALFKRHGEGRMLAVKPTHASVSLSGIEPLQYRMDGWMQEGDVGLLYGPYGAGKTTLLIWKAYHLAKGENILDRTTPCKPGKSLIIATDSGLSPLKKSMEDLGLDSDNDPIFMLGHPEQMIHIWGHDPSQGHGSWICDIKDIIRLEQFIEAEDIDYVAIDSAKAVSSPAGWSYTSNESVRALLRHLREAVAQPTKCYIEILNHDGTQKGAHAGAKSWAEEPSMVCRMELVKDASTGKESVSVEFKKDRAAVVEPRRKLTYCLTNEQLVLEAGIEKVGRCEDALLKILWEAHLNGVLMVSKKELSDEAFKRYGYSFKTVENTLPKIGGTGKGTPAKPVIKKGRGKYALAPHEIQRRQLSTPPNGALSYLGGGSTKSIGMTEETKPPTEPPNGVSGGFYQTPNPPR